MAAGFACLECGSESFVTAPMASTGTVYATTVVRIPLPGHTAPSALAYVDVDPGVRALGPLTGRAAVGDTVVVVASPGSATGVEFRADAG